MDFIYSVIQTFNLMAQLIYIVEQCKVLFFLLKVQSSYSVNVFFLTKFLESPNLQLADK